MERIVSLQSEYNFLDLFSYKKSQVYGIKIPQTILLNKNGSVKQWFFNSKKDGTIIKKKKQNLMPLNVVRSLCSHHRTCPPNYDLRSLVQFLLQSQSHLKDKYIFDIIFSNSDTISFTLSSFLTAISQNKLIEQSFSQSWHIIQQRVSHSKIPQTYIVESKRQNHTLQHKCHKMIAVNALLSYPSSELQEPTIQTTNMQEYKFFDSFLNKKFYSLNQQLLNSIQLNLKCTVQQLHCNYVIDKNRQPFLISITLLSITVNKRLYQLKQFQGYLTNNSIKLQQYMHSLTAYLEKTANETPIRSVRCRGEFCGVEVKIVNRRHNSNRKISSQLIRLVSGKRTTVVEKLISNKIIGRETYEEKEEEEFQFQEEQSKVCEECYYIYMQIMQIYSVDLYGNLVEKGKNNNNGSKIYNRESKDNIRSKVMSHMNSTINHKTMQFKKKNLIPITNVNKQQSPINRVKKIFSQANIRPNRKTLSPIGQQQRMKQMKVTAKMKFQPKPTTESISYNQLQGQLLSKLSRFQNQPRSSFVECAHRYYKTNLPQYVDRQCKTSYSIPQLYQFMNTSPLLLSKKHLIRKAPTMTLKRLSQLTDYPEIVSRSVFSFDTLIVSHQTTIPYCVITSQMLGITANDSPAQTIFLINDIFDSFLQHIILVKDILQQQNVRNKRVVLFNYPGQSHTIYNEKELNIVDTFSDVMDGLMFRVCNEKDNIKFIGIGYGGHLIQCYIGMNRGIFIPLLSGVLLLNTYKHMGGSGSKQSYMETMHDLLKIYQEEDPTSSAYMYYSKLVDSAESSAEDLQHKAGLNPIRVAGRIHLLKAMKEGRDDGLFEAVDWCPVWHVFGRQTKFRQDKQSWGINRQGEQINKRKIVQIGGGHDAIADNYVQVAQIIGKFVAGEENNDI